MKITKLLLLTIFIASFSLTGCTQRLVDFTTISSKNVELGVDRTTAVQTSGKKSYVFGFGWNVKDALDNALSNAGPEYDMLIDGVVRSTSYFFVVSIQVDGAAISSRQMRASMGDEEFDRWLLSANIFDPENASVTAVEN
ncbi:MAG: hypothetical protein ACFCU6_15100 [Balneolaceae bacterium]